MTDLRKPSVLGRGVTAISKIASGMLGRRNPARPGAEDFLAVELPGQPRVDPGGPVPGPFRRTPHREMQAAAKPEAEPTQKD